MQVVDDPEPVEILGMIELAPSAAPGDGWVPHDPFGVGTNAMFGDIVIGWAAQQDSELAGRLNRLTERHNTAFWTAHDKQARTARRQAEAELIGRYGPRLRDDRAVLDGLIMIRVAAHEGEHAGAVKLIKQGTFGLYEELLFRLVSAYPLPQELADPLRERYRERERYRQRERNRQRGQGPQPEQDPEPAPLWNKRVAEDAIRNPAARLGAYDVPTTFLNVTSDALGRFVTFGPEREQVGVLLAACLITAARNADHPLRRLIAERPELLFELDDLRQLRNPLAHRLGDTPTVADDLRWCQELADAATRELLELPPSS